eukprot:gene31051-38378_t
MLLEYCPATLRDLIAQCNEHNECIPEDTLWLIVHNLIAGLSLIHSSEVVHLDLRPENILIAYKSDTRHTTTSLEDTSAFSAPVIKIADFGSAVHEWSNFRDMEGDCKYMAPELLNDLAARTSADMFSLGLVLLELCMCGGGGRTDGSDVYVVESVDSTVVTSDDATVDTSSSTSAVGTTDTAFAFTFPFTLPSEGDKWTALRSGSLPLLSSRLSLDFRDLLKGLLAVVPEDRLTSHAVRYWERVQFFDTQCVGGGEQQKRNTTSGTIVTSSSSSTSSLSDHSSADGLLRSVVENVTERRKDGEQRRNRSSSFEDGMDVMM